MKKRMAFAFGTVLLSGWGQAGPESLPVQKEPKVESVQALMDRVKLPGSGLPIRLFAQGKNLTVNLVTPNKPMKAHYHASHEEVIYILQGWGKMRLGNKTQEVKKGDIVYVPVHTVHDFVPESGDCRALSVFAPAFDGKDRIFVEENRSSAGR